MGQYFCQEGVMNFFLFWVGERSAGKPPQLPYEDDRSGSQNQWDHPLWKVSRGFGCSFSIV